MMKFILTILAALALCKASAQEKDCFKITCLNPVDTLYASDYEHTSYFLIESYADTLVIIEVVSSHGGEVPGYHGTRKIFPDNPDTIVVKTLLNGHYGAWYKASRLRTNTGCTQYFHTKFYIVPSAKD